MIYFDNAATTFPKPPIVANAMYKAMTQYGGNPGRAGHKLSMNTAEAIYNAREKCAEFFGAETENVVFTLNCTHALNIAIKGLATANAHFIISDLEHNASARPVHAASKENNITYSVAKTGETVSETIRAFESLINTRTKAIVCTMASNVTGKILPFREIAALCKKKGICFVLDAAQGAGVIPVSMDDGVNILCCPGHKGLYGPMGTGLMLTDAKYKLRTFTEGGTGSNSRDLEQPDNLPDRFECGTVNTAGIIALGAGIDFVTEKKITRIHDYEMNLCEMLINALKKNPKITLYFDKMDDTRVPLVPFNIIGTDSATAANSLSEAGFCLRGGFHCAFLAHKKMNTLNTGVIRFAPSVFNNKSEVQALIKAVGKLTG
ncbi:MAG: aminotransferase class V-fold PLP-dependent enzyme [Oscillospiraceae bacterium]|nr:aminotransferase class V-fold PLP-dependent enzyme [Oscillospiraceae bacterium]